MIVQDTKACVIKVIGIHRTNPPGRDIRPKLIEKLLNEANIFGTITFLSDVRHVIRRPTCDHSELRREL